MIDERERSDQPMEVLTHAAIRAASTHAAALSALGWNVAMKVDQTAAGRRLVSIEILIQTNSIEPSS